MLAAQVTDPFLAAIDAFIRTGGPGLSVTTTGTVASASPTITAVASTAGIAIGDTVVGNHIPTSPAPTVVAVDSAANTVTMSANATGAGAAESITFTRAPYLSSPLMGMFTNAPTLTVASVLSDMTEPTFTGYTQQAMSIAPVRKLTDGSYLEDYASVTFQPTVDPVSGVTCNGYFVAMSIGGVSTLIYAEYFANPVVFNTRFDSVEILFDGIVRNLPQWGGFEAVS